MSKFENLPLAYYGLPAKKKYPMPDMKHYKLALSWSKVELRKGRLKPDEYNTIIANAGRIKKILETKGPYPLE